MEDSSTNPYIPQESTEIHNKVYQRQSPLGKIVKIALIVTGSVSVIIAIALFFVFPMTSYEDKDARIALGNVFQPPDQLAKQIAVSSQLGFSLAYENQLYTGYGEVQLPVAEKGTQVTGETFDDNDLRVDRKYDFVRIRPLESADTSRGVVTIPPEVTVSAKITPEMLTSNEAKPEYEGLSRLNLFMKMSSETRLAQKTGDDGTTVTIEESKPSARTINDVQYQKIRYTTKNENHRIANEKYDDCYYTIQNDFPYAVCVTNIRPNNVSPASLVERIIETVSYQKPKIAVVATETTDDKAKKEIVDDTDVEEDTEESALITKTPEYNENPLSLKAIAKTQPSVVRIGTLYCADVSLKFESGQTATKLTDACVGNSSTGTIVSQDGYIATTGHAVRYDPKAAINGYINFAETKQELFDRLNRVLDYLLKAGFIYESDVTYLKNGATTGDQEALAKIENLGSLVPDDYISAEKEEYAYSIQPTDKPIVINRNVASKPTFAYSDSVISAKFVAADYDSKKSAQEKFGTEKTKNDTALLKAEGSFQNVVVPAGLEVKADNKLNTIGFPAYTDSGLSIDKIRNIPTVTFSAVTQVYEDKKLIQTDDAVLPGNDGAPVVNQAAQLIGFATYGLSYCPDQQCSANGTVRSTSELLAMVEKQNIKLGTASKATETWSLAVDEYFKGNYSAASSQFASAGESYGFNGYAAKLQKLSDDQKGSKSDTSLYNQLTGVMIGLLVTLVIATVLLAVAFFVHKRRINSLQVGHYGAQTAPMPVMSQPAQYPQQPPMSPAPAQSQWTQPVNPAPIAQQPAINPGATQNPWPQQPQAPTQPPQSQAPAQPQQPPASEDPFYK